MVLRCSGPSVFYILKRVEGCTEKTTRRVQYVLGSRQFSSINDYDHKFDVVPRKLVPLKSIKSEDLGASIMFNSESRRASLNGTQKILNKGVITAKILSLSSSALGIVMIPVLTGYLWDAAQERPSMMAFAVAANSILMILSFTPFLLQFLVKRFIVDVQYNPATKVFTTVHYGFFLNKRALRFRAEDVVDAAKAPEMKKLWLPLATAFVYSRPLLLSLDINAYINHDAFKELTKNISIPAGSD